LNSEWPGGGGDNDDGISFREEKTEGFVSEWIYYPSIKGAPFRLRRPHAFPSATTNPKNKKAPLKGLRGRKGRVYNPGFSVLSEFYSCFGDSY
jgi:hypothetical protein